MKSGCLGQPINNLVRAVKSRAVTFGTLAGEETNANCSNRIEEEPAQRWAGLFVLARVLGRFIAGCNQA